MSNSLKIKTTFLDKTPEGKTKYSLIGASDYLIKIDREKFQLIDECQIFDGILFMINQENDINNLFISGLSRNNGIKKINKLLLNDSESFWKTIIIAQTTSLNLSDIELDYLIQTIYNNINNIDACIVEKQGLFNKQDISKDKLLKLNEFINNILIIMNFIGYNFFDNEVIKINNKDLSEDTGLCVYINGMNTTTNTKISAKGIYVNKKKFVLLKGSFIDPMVRDSLENWVIDKRVRDTKDGKIIDNILQEDIQFNSPSGAARYVRGRTVNGWTAWKIEGGETLSKAVRGY